MNSVPHNEMKLSFNDRGGGGGVRAMIEDKDRSNNHMLLIKGNLD